MKCKCGKEMTFLFGDEFVELYICVNCNLYGFKNIELVEESFYLKEVE